MVLRPFLKIFFVITNFTAVPSKSRPRQICAVINQSILLKPKIISSFGSYAKVEVGIRVSDALFIRRNNKYPKFVINEAQAYTTDTMHRVTVKEGIDMQALTASYYNSLSLAYSEICGRSHGGGVLELIRFARPVLEIPKVFQRSFFCITSFSASLINQPSKRACLSS